MQDLLTLSYLVNHAFNTSLFIELLLHTRRSDSTYLLSPRSMVESPAVFLTYTYSHSLSFRKSSFSIDLGFKKSKKSCCHNSAFILFTKSSTFTGFGIKQSVSNP